MIAPSFRRSEFIALFLLIVAAQNIPFAVAGTFVPLSQSAMGLNFRELGLYLSGLPQFVALLLFPAAAWGVDRRGLAPILIVATAVALFGFVLAVFAASIGHREIFIGSGLLGASAIALCSPLFLYAYAIRHTTEERRFEILMYSYAAVEIGSTVAMAAHFNIVSTNIPSIVPIAFYVAIACSCALYLRRIPATSSTTGSQIRDGQNLRWTLSATFALFLIGVFLAGFVFEAYGKHYGAQIDMTSLATATQTVSHLFGSGSDYKSNGLVRYASLAALTMAFLKTALFVILIRICRRLPPWTLLISAIGFECGAVLLSSMIPGSAVEAGAVIVMAEFGYYFLAMLLLLVGAGLAPRTCIFFSVGLINLVLLVSQSVGNFVATRAFRNGEQGPEWLHFSPSQTLALLALLGAVSAFILLSAKRRRPLEPAPENMTLE